MVTVKHLDAGTSHTFNFTQYDATVESNGTLVSSTSNTNGQQRSLESNGNNTTSSCIARVQKTGVLGPNGRASLGFTFDKLPSNFSATDTTKQNRIFDLDTSGLAAGCFCLCLDTSGHLHIVDHNAPANRGTGTATLAINTRYRINLAWTLTSTTVNEIRVWVATGDGTAVLDITLTNVTIGSASPADLLYGMNLWDCTAGSCKLYFTDVYVDDSSALTEVGNVHVTPERPNANGTTNGFTTQIGASGSGVGTGHAPQVNERPLSQTNGWSMIGVGSAVTEEYAIQGRSAGDVDLTSAIIIDFMGWVYAKSALSETGNIIVAGVSTNIALTSTATMFMKVAGSTTYPAGGTDIGIITSTTVTTVSLYECGILIAYYGNLQAIVPPILALTISTFAPKLNLGIIPPVTALVLTEFAPKLNLGIVPPVTALTLTEYAPNPGYGYVPVVVNLLTTLFAPKLNLGIVPPVTNLVLTGYAPKLDLGIVPGVVNLLLTEYAPKLGLGIIPPLLALILTKFSPLLDLGIIPPTLALTLTEYAPKLGLTIIPGVLNLVLQFFGPRAEIDHPPISDFPFEGGIVIAARPPVGSAQFRK